MCKFCELFDFGSVGIDLENIMTGKPMIMLAGGRPVDKESRFKYCPVCGEALKKSASHTTTSCRWCRTKDRSLTVRG